jgi:hypothetical protein
MCVYLWRRNLGNDKPLALWIGWFASMQLYEFFMWRDMKHHTIVSKISLVSILLQPFVLAAALLYYNKYVSIDKVILISISLLSLIKAGSAFIYAFFIDKHKEWLSITGPNCHLRWWFCINENLLPKITHFDPSYFLPLFFAGLVGIKPLSHGFLYALFGAVAYYLTKRFYPLELNSLWCWIANLLAILAIALPYFKI